MPNSKDNPRYTLSGSGTIIKVVPEYATIKGRDAIVGNNNLYLHLKLRTSSAKPKNVIKHTESAAALY